MIITIGDATVTSVDSIGVLRLKFDHLLKVNPHFEALSAALATIASMVRQLRAHLPAECATDVARALMVGKVRYGAAAALFPWLTLYDPQLGSTDKLQAWVNNAARAGCGIGQARPNHITYLLSDGGFPSVNWLVVKVVAVEILEGPKPERE